MGQYWYVSMPFRYVLRVWGWFHHLWPWFCHLMHKVYTQYESAVCVVQTCVSMHVVSTTELYVQQHLLPCMGSFGGVGSLSPLFHLYVCSPPLSRSLSLCSNVIEKCITHASRQERALLVEEVCSCQDEWVQWAHTYVLTCTRTYIHTQCTHTNTRTHTCVQKRISLRSWCHVV